MMSCILCRESKEDLKMCKHCRRIVCVYCYNEEKKSCKECQGGVQLCRKTGDPLEKYKMQACKTCNYLFSRDIMRYGGETCPDCEPIFTDDDYIKSLKEYLNSLSKYDLMNLSFLDTEFFSYKELGFVDNLHVYTVNCGAIKNHLGEENMNKKFLSLKKNIAKHYGINTKEKSSLNQRLCDSLLSSVPDYSIQNFDRINPMQMDLSDLFWDTFGCHEREVQAMFVVRSHQLESKNFGEECRVNKIFQGERDIYMDSYYVEIVDLENNIIKVTPKFVSKISDFGRTRKNSYEIKEN